MAPVADRAAQQLIALTGTQTMLQMTALRMADAEMFAPPIVAAGADQEAEIAALEARGRCVEES